MRRSAAIYIFLLLILTGVYYYINNRTSMVDQATSSSTPVPVEYLFSSDDGLPINIRIESKEGSVLELARDADNVWVLNQPLEASADQASVEAATGQITTIRVLDHIPNLAKDSVGLADPEYTLTIQFTGDVERIVEVGVLTPTGNGYYASRNDADILIVNNSGLDALIGLLNDPPYQATETPSPSPLEGATPQP